MAFLRLPMSIAGLVAGAALAAASPAPAAPVTVTLGFDDGMGTRNDPAQILALTGTRATFYVNTVAVDRATVDEVWSHEFLSWDQLAALHDAGHEIAGHTLHHRRLTPPDPGGHVPPPTGPTEAEIRTEVCDDRAVLREAGYPALSFAYPFGRWDARSRAIVQECGYLSGRTTSAPDPAETLPPADPFATHAFNADGMDSEQLLGLVGAAKARGGGWVQLVFHDICEPDDQLCNGSPANAVTPWDLRKFVAALALDPEVQVKTAGEVLSTAPGTPGGGTPPGDGAPPPGGPSGAAPPPAGAPPGAKPSAQLDRARAAAVRRARARLVRARGRALRVCNRKRARPARSTCRKRVRARYARRLARLPTVRVASTRR